METPEKYELPKVGQLWTCHFHGGSSFITDTKSPMDFTYVWVNKGDIIMVLDAFEIADEDCNPEGRRGNIAYTSEGVVEVRWRVKALTKTHAVFCNYGSLKDWHRIYKRVR